MSHKNTKNSKTKGSISDYLTGELRPNTPEEKVRQLFVKQLHEKYGYPKDLIELEFSIQRGSKGKKPEAADIVIFNSKKRSQNNIFLIVETKEPSVSDYDFQLSSYVTATTAEWCVWTNGKKTSFFKTNIGTKGAAKFTDVWTIPHFKQKLGAPQKSNLVSPENLTKLFQDMHDWIWANSNIKKADRITSNIINVLFCKIYDELSLDQFCKFYTVFDSHDQPDPNQTHDNLIRLFKDVKEEYSDIFYTTDSIEFNKKTTLYLVSKLQQFSFMYSNVDAIGAGFEVFTSESLKEDYGQFFTPRQVIKFMVEVINPKTDEKILDPACGSGGFLIETLHHVREILNDKMQGKIPDEKLSELKRRMYSRNFFGIDQERDLAKISKAYMAIVGDGSGGIFSEDSLEDPKDWETITRPELQLNKFDVIFTNPPFGKDIKVSGKLLEQFDLAKKLIRNNGNIQLTNKLKSKTAVRPSILFLERCYQFLNKKKKSSRLAIVLPVGDLSNDEDLFVKEWLLKNTEIFAIIQLPVETFEPYTGTQTCLLFLHPKENSTNTHKVFMAQAEKIGKDKRGKEIYLRNDDGSLFFDSSGGRIIDNDLTIIIDDYKNFLNNGKPKSKFSFLVDRKQLDESLLPNFHNPKNAYVLKKSKKLKIKHDSLESLCETVYTPPRTKRVYVEKQFGIPFLSGSHITQIIPHHLKFISKTETKNMDKYIVNEGDIVITRVGTMGIVRLIGKDLDGYAVSDNINIIKIDKRKIAPEYVFAVLYSKMGLKVVTKVSKGSVQHYNTPEAIKKIQIPILSDPEYSQIVNLIKNSEKKRVKAVSNIFDAEEILESFIDFS